ncbi:hypothetical protein CANCADRAFT_28621 [Tortispora caseinolytica NRRL Y-17796]|uniref:Probable cytosolic iron-sulfur protein assembly protein 1 n=1 Tax=Tortispora caseinolytica NRRL Y-17796 TaxID=767744 RepID=A0A1E4T9R3_9ASCO|nr:hypothetical protein CANCADRAFT_28621 [Tortispora caseinolytica NRRL Y-17796]
MVRQIAALDNHTDRVWDIEQHASLPLVACASADKSASVFRVPRSLTEPWTLVETLADTHKRSVRAVAWKKKEAVLATASFDASVGIWQPEGGEEGRAWECLATLEGHENEVKDVVWSCSGRYIATCSRDRSVWVWEVFSEEESDLEFDCVAVLQEHTQDVKRLAFSPTEEDLLISASYDDTIRVWREDTDGEWSCAATLTSHKSTVWGVDFEPQTEPAYAPRFVSCSDDRTVQVWIRDNPLGAMPSSFRTDPCHETWSVQCVLPEAHTRPVYSVAWGPKGIASAGGDGLICIYKEDAPGVWSIAHRIPQAHEEYEINVVAWGQVNGQTVLYSGGDDAKVRVWLIE